jgi:2-phosphosulfolactate phosphatase
VRIDVAPTPRELRAQGDGDAVVVVDVFRASTTIVTAIANGARLVVPVTDVEQAVRLAKPFGPGEAVLAGERSCRRIEGFALGNSPREFTREAVAGKTVIFTTTNGTEALAAACDAGAVVVGCFLNLSRVAEELRGHDSVTVLCAGNEGRLSLEDFVCAGGLVTRLEQGAQELSDAAWAAAAAFERLEGDLRGTLLETEHAHRLAGLGFAADLELALRVDAVPTLPRFADGRIVAVMPGA